MERGKRRAFKGVEFLQSMKLGSLDLSIGGNIFNDDGYRLGEKTDRKRFNLNSTYRHKNFEGLSYGINANILIQNSLEAQLFGTVLMKLIFH